MAREEELLEKILETLKTNNGPSGFKSTPITSGIGVIDKAASQVNSFTNSMGGLLSEWETATKKFGINWNNDALGLTTSIGKSRMSFDEWSNAISASRVGFLSLGGTMNESAKIFTNVATGFRDSDASESLAKMAWSTGEYNKLLALNMTSNRQLNLNNVKDREELYESTKKLGMEMDKISQLTGMSRKDQMDQMEENRNDVRFQANKRLLEAQGFEVGAAAIEDFAGKSGALNSLIKNYSQGGVLTDENRKASQAIGTDMAEKLRIATIQLQTSKTDTEKEINLQRINAIKEEIIVRLNSTESLRRITRGEDEVSEKAREIVSSNNMAFMNAGDAVRTTAKTLGVTNQEAMQILKNQVTKSQQGLDPEGRMYAGSKTTEGIIKGQRALEDLAKVPNEAAQAFQEKIGKTLAQPGKSGSVLDKLSTVDKETGEKMSDKIYGDFGKNFTKSIANETFIHDLKTNIELGFKQGLNNIKSIVAESIEITGNVAGDLLDIPHLANGTKNTYGDWFQDFGQEGKLHWLDNEEAAVPKSQLANFIFDNIKNIGKNQASIMDTFGSSFNISANELMKNIPQPQVNTSYDQPAIDTTQTEITTNNNVTLKDINDQLISLNMSIVKLVSSSEGILDISDKHYYVSKGMSPNLNVR